MGRRGRGWRGRCCGLIRALTWGIPCTVWSKEGGAQGWVRRAFYFVLILCLPEGCCVMWGVYPEDPGVWRPDVPVRGALGVQVSRNR